MTREYKIGDRVRMLTNVGMLVKGDVYRVEAVDGSDDYLPVSVGEHGDWPTKGTFELVTEEDAPEKDNKPWKGMIRAVNYTCVGADGSLETNHYIAQFDGEHWNQIPAYHDIGFGKLTRLEDRGPRGKDGGVLLDETSYILTITDGSISYVGPFVSPAAASDYGDRYIDDPRWNVIPESLVLPLGITSPVEAERVRVQAASIASLADRIEDVIADVWDIDTTWRDVACAIAEDFYAERKGWDR